MKILVAEDEPKLNRGLVLGLQHRGYIVNSAFDGEEGERMARNGAYDVLIFDVMMPKQSGVEACRRLRDAGITTPILFLTARDALEEKVEGLDAGGDDYVVKPFAFEELVARIRTLTRRGTLTSHEVLALDTLRLDPRARQVTVNEKVIDLTLREYGLLEYMLRHKGAVVTREEMLEHVWDQYFDTLSNVVDVHLKNLRKKLPAAYAKRIETVWGKGYRLA